MEMRRVSKLLSKPTNPQQLLDQQNVRDALGSPSTMHRRPCASPASRPSAFSASISLKSPARFSAHGLHTSSALVGSMHSRSAAGRSSTGPSRGATSAAQRRSPRRGTNKRPMLIDVPPAAASLQDVALLGIDAIARRHTGISPPGRSAARDVVHVDELNDRFADDEDSRLNGSPGRRRVFAEIMKRKIKAYHGGRACQKCHRSKTPRWRRGPSGPKTLCNVCGLLYAKRESRRLRDSWLVNVSRGL
ncbi:hypothetical protein RB594_004614 [Gaeumannomyces avenae]